MRTVSGGSAGLPSLMGGGDGGATRPARRLVDAICRSRTCTAPGKKPAPRRAARDRRGRRVRRLGGGAGLAAVGIGTGAVRTSSPSGRPWARRADVAAVVDRGRRADDCRWRVRAAHAAVGRAVSVRGRSASGHRGCRQPDRDDTPDLGRRAPPDRRPAATVRPGAAPGRPRAGRPDVAKVADRGRDSDDSGRRLRPSHRAGCSVVPDRRATASGQRGRRCRHRDDAAAVGRPAQACPGRNSPARERTERRRRVGVPVAADVTRGAARRLDARSGRRHRDRRRGVREQCRRGRGQLGDDRRRGHQRLRPRRPDPAA